jgi:hypothetical protein
MKKLAVVSVAAASLVAIAQHAHTVVAIIFPGIGW